MKYLILTGADECMKSIADLTSANHKAYALRHGYDFERVTDFPTDCHPAWHKLKIIQDRLPRYDAILWLDADTVVTFPFIDPFSEGFGAGPCITLSQDWSGFDPNNEAFFSTGNFVIRNHPGAFELLEKASLRTRWKHEPLWEQEAIQEEYRENPEIRRHFTILPRRTLNAVPLTPRTSSPDPWQKGDFLCHLTFQSNEHRVQMFPSYDQVALRIGIPKWHESTNCTDIRHIQCMREIIQGAKWKSALEIGCWTGCSTAAFVQGVQNGTIEKFTACDLKWSDEFRYIIADIPVSLFEKRSVEVLADSTDYDLIFVDGDHSLATGAEETLHILRRQPRCVMAHGINSTNAGFQHCEGAAHLLTELQRDGWTCLVDQKVRLREKTERGFMAATKDADLIPVLQRAFDLTCY